jgi:two-component system, chemotaxis family, chemotaxis protein CheY
MKILAAEDDFISRKVIQKILSSYGEVDVTVDGIEAVKAAEELLKTGKSYDLICLDINMPNMDGQDALEKIRELEEVSGITGNARSKVIMTTALDDPQVILRSFNMECDAYVNKPLVRQALEKELINLGLLSG